MQYSPRGDCAVRQGRVQSLNIKLTRLKASIFRDLTTKKVKEADILRHLNIEENRTTNSATTLKLRYCDHHSVLKSTLLEDVADQHRGGQSILKTYRVFVIKY